jgi:DNA-binding transcriptional regulator YiaG
MTKRQKTWTSTAIKRLRKRRRASQTAFGILLGVSIMTVSRWERGVSVPAPQQRTALDKLMGEPSNG